MGGVLLATLVDTSGAVAATRSRKAKVEALAELLRVARPRRGRGGRRVPHRRRAPGAHRGGLAIGLPAGRRARRRAVGRDPRGRPDPHRAGRHGGAGLTGRPPGAAHRPLLPRHRARGRLRPPPAHRRAPAGRAGRGDDRRRRHRGGHPDRHRPARRDALGRPRSHRGARADRRAARPSRPCGWRCCTRSSRCWPPAPPTSPRRSATPARRRWSGSSTARGCRCTGSATRCASTPATSTTSPTGSPAWWRWRATCPVTSVVLDGEVLGVHEDATPQAFQDTMSAFGRDGGVGRGGAPARALLRHPPPRRRRPHRRAARRAPAPPRRGGRRARHPARRHGRPGRGAGAPRRRARPRATRAPW